jgi:tetratricopeptide (TPR) repeat protein
MNADKHASGKTKDAKRAINADRTNGKNTVSRRMDALTKKKVRGTDRTRSNNLATTRIESLLKKGQWRQADAVIRMQLQDNPGDHWLWARLSGASFEQRNYQEALEAAEKAVTIVRDCPLALWSKAGALQMLGQPKEASTLYLDLARRGLKELLHPDADANECWEGADWTSSLVADCVFQAAACLAAMNSLEKAVETYRTFLSLIDIGMQGVYSREDALRRLRRLIPNKKAKRQMAAKLMEELVVC